MLTSAEPTKLGGNVNNILRRLAWAKLVVAGALVSSRAFAAPAIPLCAWSSEPPLLEVPRPLDENRPFFARVGPNTYAIPWKYLLSPPSRDAPSCAFPREGAAVQFSLPNGEPVPPNRDTPSGVETRSNKRDRAKPASTTIQVFTSGYATPDPPPRLNPKSSFNNLSRAFSNIAVSDYKDMVMVAYNHLTPGQAGFFYESETYDVFYNCVFVEECQSYIFLKKERLAFGMYVSKRSIDFHADLAKQLERLFAEWRVSTTEYNGSVE